MMANWERDDNPIDKELKTCLDDPEHGSTRSMVDCEQKAYEAWDKELNSVYADLIKTLPKEQQQDLREDQRNWLKFRDTEFKFIDDIYDSKQGTMFRPLKAGAATELVKDRTLQLHNRLDVLNFW